MRQILLLLIIILANAWPLTHHSRGVLENLATHLPLLNKPQGGELYSLPGEALNGIHCLRAVEVKSFRISPNYSQDILVRWRLFEGAWPIRLDLESRYLVTSKSELETDCPESTELCQEEEVLVVDCPH